MTTVLTIEQDRDAATEIVDELTRRGYRVEHIESAREGLKRALNETWDLVTLGDIASEAGNTCVLRAMREVGIETPVLMISSRGDLQSRVSALRTGADAYLIKPFSTEEMVARLEALNRRCGSAPAPAQSLRHGSIELDLIARTVQRNGEPIALTPKEFKVLEVFLRHAGTVITRSMLYEAVWGYHFDPGTNLVDVNVGKLRRKFNVAGKPALIRAVRGAGYVLD
ncbi:response regulator transcription factor [Paraburkholderia sp. Ac-20340]|uniref:response regulator transcription factor n=1 Tax=Paraburkholderia sp. Ac-20340 TaxID=2703888 RepID=UPI0019818B57|nr:response regulator transcription factor [Paraburkholderia sp. Ac-20340]MBN3855016.1 response regulator transcription factor [Paraburkholderia sp. Ac-20340]